jgi:hypothetical protein
VSALLKMNVSPRAALAIVMLAACVSLLAAGREARAPAPAPVAHAPEREAPRESPLELDKLERPGLGEPLANLFATPRPAAPAARAARPATPPPPAPVAPPLPFRYLGRYVEGGRSAVYLARGDEPVLAVQGETLPGGYRVEEVAPDAVTLLYLPLGTRQRLPVPPHP